MGGGGESVEIDAVADVPDHLDARFSCHGCSAFQARANIARAGYVSLDGEWDESDRRGVAAWLLREADQRVKFFPQRRDGVDALVRHLAHVVTPPGRPS